MDGHQTVRYLPHPPRSPTTARSSSERRTAMDLTTLRDSLDSSSRERHPASVSAKRSEVRLTRDFKAAALQLTTLYRTSLTTSKRSYAAGYAQSLNDILDVVSLRLQQPASSTPGFNAAATASSSESDREELRWLARYLRARVEAIKAETEEEDKMESDEEDTNDGSLAGSVHIEPTLPASAAAEHEQRQAAASAAIEESHPSNAMRGLHALPSQSTFTFTVPGVPNSQETTPSKSRRARRHESPSVSMQHSQAISNAISSVQQHGLTTDHRRTVLRAPSPSDDDEVSQLSSPARPNLHPGRRSSSKTGKRTGGREKLSGLELFARAQNAKRRRGMGDRRDDDFDNSLL